MDIKVSSKRPIKTLEAGSVFRLGSEYFMVIKPDSGLDVCHNDGSPYDTDYIKVVSLSNGGLNGVPSENTSYILISGYYYGVETEG